MSGRDLWSKLINWSRHDSLLSTEFFITIVSLHALFKSSSAITSLSPHESSSKSSDFLFIFPCPLDPSTKRHKLIDFNIRELISLTHKYNDFVSYTRNPCSASGSLDEIGYCDIPTTSTPSVMDNVGQSHIGIKSVRNRFHFSNENTTSISDLLTKRGVFKARCYWTLFTKT